VRSVPRGAIEAKGVRAAFFAAVARFDMRATGWRATRGRRRTEAPIHPLLRTFAGELQATLVRACLYACVLAAFVLIGMELFARTPGAMVAQPTAPDWIDVIKPIPAFALSIPELSSEPQYAIRRHATGGGRRDIIAFGDAAAQEATATVEIYRPGAEADQPGESVSLPELRLSVPVVWRMIDTKFGLAAIEPFTDRGAQSAQGAQGERACLRVTRAFEDPRLVITAQFCNPGLELVDRHMVACALDRLTLISAASDPKLTALFARAELKRNFCGQTSVFLAATPRRTDWIEAPRDPKLRGRQ
jgi:hypothetical protein